MTPHVVNLDAEYRDGKIFWQSRTNITLQNAEVNIVLRVNASDRQKAGELIRQFTRAAVRYLNARAVILETEIIPENKLWLLEHEGWGTHIHVVAAPTEEKAKQIATGHSRYTCEVTELDAAKAGLLFEYENSPDTGRDFEHESKH